MDKFVQLFNDIVKLLGKYGGSYVSGIWNTLLLALVATAIGCIIGFVCGVLNTIPYSQNDPLPKRFFLKLIARVSLNGFALYVTIIGVLVIVLQLTGVLNGSAEAAVQSAELAGKLFG